MELQVGVKILLQNKKGEYLILERSKEKYADVVNRWDIPGGRISSGSSLLENLKREVFEETGLHVTEEPKLFSAQDILKTDKHIVRLTYLGSADGEVVLSDEHVSYKWVSREELQSIEFLDIYVKKILFDINK